VQKLWGIMAVCGFVFGVTMVMDSRAVQAEQYTSHEELLMALDALKAQVEQLQMTVEALAQTDRTPCGTGTESQRFVLVENDQAVCDNTTGYVWERSLDTTTRDFEAAIGHCSQRVVNGQTGYRLPTVKQLISLLDYSQSSPALPSGHPFKNVQQGFFWSATTNVAAPPFAWVVRFSFGFVGSFIKSNTGFVWCVRG
jgi:hypothetical protein